MKVNKNLLPIKAHYFFFMAAMGPILPQLSVYGKQLGISPEIMGSVTGCLPILFLIAKPMFGLLVDIYRDNRKTIFMALLISMSTSYALLCFLPPRTMSTFEYKNNICDKMSTCNVTDIISNNTCNNTKYVNCIADDYNNIEVNGMIYLDQFENFNESVICLDHYVNICNKTHSFRCHEISEISHDCLYKTWEFWYFIVLMALGTIGFNVTNSISDAICFDVIGEEFDYGKQRVWGTIGFGISALIAGYIVDLFSTQSLSYIPAFMVMLFCTFLDIISCIKLELPIMAAPENIFKDLKKLLKNLHTVVFISFAVLAGIVDSFMVYFLFWYIEDLAQETGMKKTKLLEGLIVAAETLGGEVIFFSLSGKILERFGHAYSFSMCFIFYALRLALISVAPSPWWILPIEFLMQGPTYALTYTTIVAYANAISPPGASATMQGIAAGMDDGFGYAIGSFLGGYLYKYVGKREALQIYAAIALVSSIAHFTLYKTVLQRHEVPTNLEYRTPTEAALAVESGS